MRKLTATLGKLRAARQLKLRLMWKHVPGVLPNPKKQENLGVFQDSEQNFSPIFCDGAL
jgi:hypothetical protein